MSQGKRRFAVGAVVAASFIAGLAYGQDDGMSDDTRDKLAKVRRVVKQVDLDKAIGLVPQLLAREKEYDALTKKLLETAQGGGDTKPLLTQGRNLKLAALADLNNVLEKHKGKYAGIKEKEVWQRLRDARFANVAYEDEWLVNILDDLEEAAKINIELDARVYKFDTVSFDFERTSARAMMQIMADALLFSWVVRGDTLYVYKERHEVLFGGDWIKQKKAAYKARKKAIEDAAKAAEKRAAEGGAK